MRLREYALTRLLPADEKDTSTIIHSNKEGKHDWTAHGLVKITLGESRMHPGLFKPYVKLEAGARKYELEQGVISTFGKHYRGHFKNIDFLVTDFEDGGDGVWNIGPFMDAQFAREHEPIAVIQYYDNEEFDIKNEVAFLAYGNLQITVQYNEKTNLWKIIPSLTTDGKTIAYDALNEYFEENPARLEIDHTKCAFTRNRMEIQNILQKFPGQSDLSAFRKAYQEMTA